MSREAKNEHSRPNQSVPLSTFMATRVLPFILDAVDLSDANIGATEAKEIAKILATSTAWKSLDLSDNNIDDEAAVALADGLAMNKSLTKLWLCSNDINDRGMTALAQALSHNDSLEKLSFSFSPVGIVGVKGLAHALKTNNRLRKLSLFDCDIDHEGAAFLADALKSNTCLVSLDLRGNKIKGAAALADALKSNSSVTSLNLAWNKIKDEGMVAMADALRRNTTLQRINLNGNYLGSEGVKEILCALEECNTTLTFFGDYEDDDDYMGAYDEDDFALQNFVLANRAGIRLLRAEGELDLSLKEIGTGLSAVVARELAVSEEITTLNLSHNNIEHGYMAIANALAANHTLKSLRFDGNDIGDAGACAFAKAISQNTVLASLFLNENWIGTRGVAALAKAFATNSTLQHVGLGRNRIGDECVAALADGLKRRTTLTRLDLDNNRISDSGANVLLKALTTPNCSIMSINLQGNTNISVVLLRAIKCSLAFKFWDKRVVKLPGESAVESGGQPMLKPCAIGLGIQAVHRASNSHKDAVLTQADKTAVNASTVLRLVRATALNDL
jgi:Ran GTPase-activating protein (RanGAP) involved in mRNA processing and transport